MLRPMRVLLIAECRRRGRRKRFGAAAVELALLLPFLGLMFTAAVDFGRVFYITQTLQESATAGAMYASGTIQTSASQGQAQAATSAACATAVSIKPPLDPQDVTVVLDASAGTATVTVTYNFQLVTPILGPLGQVQLTRTATMKTAPRPGD